VSPELLGTPSDVTYGRVDTTGSAITYTPSGQISTFSRDNDSYKWNGHFNVNRLYGANGLDQLIAATPGAGQTSVANLGYDGRGNLNLSGTTSYVYTTENRLAIAGSQTLAYDSVDRLLFVGGVAVFRYDGTELIQERSPSNGLARRYVHGPGTDEPLVWYEGAGTTDRRWLHADERGSIIAVSNSAGSVIAINSYDEYGIPASTNQGRFQYTGQTWLPEIGLYYYKARMYSPTLGRFMQTDLMGYAYGMNWYNYVGADPVNKTDPSGLADADIVVIGRRPMPNPSVINCYDGGCDRSRSAVNGGFDGNSRIGYGNTYGYGQQSYGQQITVTASSPTSGAATCMSTNVNISGRITTAGAGPSYARFYGTITDVSNGRSYSFVYNGFGTSIGMGTFSVSGTIKSTALNGPFQIGWWSVGEWKLSLDGAAIQNQGGDAGIISVSSTASTPAGIYGLAFNGGNLKMISRGNGC
jgi:RHS repeat-associated protein